MQTTLEPPPKPRTRRFGETAGLAEPKRQPETLDQAKRRLIELQRQAAARGIQFPPLERPTLGKVQTEIAVLEQALTPADINAPPKAVTPVTTTQPAASPQAAAPLDSSTLFAKAGAIASKYKQTQRQSSSRAAPPTKTPAPGDLSRSELMREIQKAGSHEQRAALFRELRRREKGEPSRRSIELASRASDEELEKMIEHEKDADRRSELFRCLCQREEWRRKS